MNVTDDQIEAFSTTKESISWTNGLRQSSERGCPKLSVVANNKGKMNCDE
jgi:hypothetical protein